MIIKVDSGPSQINVGMLANLRAKGFYLYPGVPNTTAITHETDQSFGEFKNSFRRILKKLTNDRLEFGCEVF